MPEPKEVLRYELDATQMLAELHKLEQRLEEIKAKRGRGEDVSALEAAFYKEVDGLTRVAQAEKQAVSATDDLVREKEKLANVVTLLGGRFGGMVTQVGNVIQLLIRGGAAAIAFAAALAMFSGVTTLFEGLAAAAQKAEDAIRRVIQAQREAARESISLQKEVADALAGAGIVGRAGAGRATAEELMRAGLERQLAIFGAVAQQVGGLAPGQVGRVTGAWVLGGRQGAFGLDQAENQKLIQQLLAVDRDQAVAALRARMTDVAFAEVPPEPTSEVQRKRAATAARLQQKPLTEREREVGMRLLGGEDPEEFFSWFFRRFIWGPPAAQRRGLALYERPSGDATHTMAELLDIARGAEKEIQQEAPTTQPIIINIEKEYRIENEYRAGHIQMAPNKQMISLATPRPRLGRSTQDHRKPP